MSWDDLFYAIKLFNTLLKETKIKYPDSEIIQSIDFAREEIPAGAAGFEDKDYDIRTFVVTAGVIEGILRGEKEAN